LIYEIVFWVGASGKLNRRNRHYFVGGWGQRSQWHSSDQKVLFADWAAILLHWSQLNILFSSKAALCSNENQTGTSPDSSLPHLWR